MDRLLAGCKFDFKQNDIVTARKYMITHIFLQSMNNNEIVVEDTKKLSAIIENNEALVTTSSNIDILNVDPEAENNNEISVTDRETLSTQNTMTDLTGLPRLTYGLGDVSEHQYWRKSEVFAGNMSPPMLSSLYLLSSDTPTPDKERLPAFIHPSFNGRDIDLSDIFECKNNTNSLYQLYNQRDIDPKDVPITLIDAPMYIVCYSVSTMMESNRDWNLGLHSIYNRQVRKKDIVAIAPTISKDNILTLMRIPNLGKQIKTSKTNEEIIVHLMKFLLQLKVLDDKVLVKTGKIIFGEQFPVNVNQNIHDILKEFCTEFQKKFNLYLSCVEGQHRMLASSLAWKDNETLTDIPTLLRPNPSNSFYLNVAIASPSFQNAMINISNQFRQNRLVSVPSSMFHHLIIMINEICCEYRNKGYYNMDTGYSKLMLHVKTYFDVTFHPNATQTSYIDCKSIFQSLDEEQYQNTWTSLFNYELLCKTRENFHTSYYKYHKKKRVPRPFIALVLCTIIDIINMIWEPVEERDSQNGILYPRSTFAFNFKARTLSISGLNESLLYHELHVITGYIDHIATLISTLACYRTNSILSLDGKLNQKVTFFVLHSVLLSQLWSVWADHGSIIIKFIQSLQIKLLSIPVDHFDHDMYNYMDNETINGKRYILLFLYLVKETFRTPGIHLSNIVTDRKQDAPIRTDRNTVVDFFSIFKPCVTNIFLHLKDLFVKNIDNAQSFIEDVIKNTPSKSRITAVTNIHTENVGEVFDFDFFFDKTVKQDHLTISHKGDVNQEITTSREVPEPHRKKNKPNEDSNIQLLRSRSERIQNQGNKDFNYGSSTTSSSNKTRKLRRKYYKNKCLDSIVGIVESPRKTIIESPRKTSETEILNDSHKLAIQNFAEVQEKYVESEGWTPIFFSEQYAYLKQRKQCVRVVHYNHIQNINNSTVEDVCNFKAPFHVTGPNAIVMNGLDLLSMKIEIEEDLKNRNLNLNSNQNKEDKIVGNSLQTWRQHSIPKSTEIISNTMKKFQTAVQSYFESQGVTKYRVCDPSMLRDDGSNPHIGTPYINYKSTALELCQGYRQPCVILYALETFTIVLFLRKEDEFGAPFGTRIKIPKDSAIIMAGTLYYSDDIFFDCNNLRLHAYCYPDVLTYHLYEIGRRYREKRPDLTQCSVQHVTNIGMCMGNNLEMQNNIQEMMMIRSSFYEERREVVVAMFLAYYDYLCLYPTIDSDAETINVQWIQYQYMQLVDDLISFVTEDGIDIMYEP